MPCWQRLRYTVTIMAVLEAIVIQSTFPDGQTAERVAKNLLESKLIACINLIPSVRSLYHWQGKICDETEVLAVIKTTATQFEAVCKLIRAQHPYDCPEVIATPIVYGSSSYLTWMFAELVETP